MAPSLCSPAHTPPAPAKELFPFASSDSSHFPSKQACPLTATAHDRVTHHPPGADSTGNSVLSLHGPAATLPTVALPDFLKPFPHGASQASGCSGFLPRPWPVFSVPGPECWHTAPLRLSSGLYYFLLLPPSALGLYVFSRS